MVWAWRQVVWGGGVDEMVGLGLLAHHERKVEWVCRCEVVQGLRLRRMLRCRLRDGMVREASSGASGMLIHGVVGRGKKGSTASGRKR